VIEYFPPEGGRKGEGGETFLVSRFAFRVVPFRVRWFHASGFPRQSIVVYVEFLNLAVI
jgi:hypothetical protein